MSPAAHRRGLVRLVTPLGWFAWSTIAGVFTIIGVVAAPEGKLGSAWYRVHRRAEGILDAFASYGLLFVLWVAIILAFCTSSA